MLRYVIILLAALLAAGCACKAPVTPALFVVVPSPVNGHVGKIVVHRGSESRVIDTAYGAQRLTSDGTVVASTVTEAEVRKDFGAALTALPGRPASFTLYFLEGRDELTDESRVELEKVFAELKRRPLPDIVVIGHTDTVGGLSYNDKLSLARAERTREMMIALGIPPERIQAAGRGKRELLVPTEDNVSEPRNRRVEINVR
ncbi:MAG TPA: OmpA family protein [Usitatibacter sp.]|nr:OmpA family protein [Usitatibacter sp.]